MKARLKRDITGRRFFINVREGGCEGGYDYFFAKGTEGSVVGKSTCYDVSKDTYSELYIVSLDTFAPDPIVLVDERDADIIGEKTGIKDIMINKRKAR
jgi:hypothetical protein